MPARRAFAVIAHPPSVRPATAVLSQVKSHSSAVSRVYAMPAATSASTPIPTPPHPGTAVKAVARSMVSRIKERLSMARAWRAGESAGVGGTRWGEAIKCFTV